jgi:peptidoglycan-N-acetylglucosamine deacetylase
MISITFDVETDIHSDTYKSLEKGIPKLLLVLEKFKIKATFFVPAKLLEKFPEYFQNLENKGHEIGLHGYEHERFDELSFKEKEKRIEESIKIYKKIFKKNPKGFRAPQHSIDEQTLKILKRNNFIYDSSYTPFNFLQIIFFPKKLKHGLKGFFKKKGTHKINKDFYEIPTSSLILPFVSLPLRIFPWKILKIYLFLLKKTNKDLIFYAHSWDLIELPKSKIDRIFSHKRLLKNLNRMIVYLSKKNKFVKMQDLI